jgi:hypothetical protein
VPSSSQVRDEYGASALSHLLRGVALALHCHEALAAGLVLFNAGAGACGCVGAEDVLEETGESLTSWACWPPSRPASSITSKHAHAPPSWGSPPS